MGRDAVYYGSLPNPGIRTRCPSPHNQGSRVKGKMLRIDPDRNGTITRQEFEANYPHNSWKKFYGRYNAFYWKWRRMKDEGCSRDDPDLKKLTQLASGVVYMRLKKAKRVATRATNEPTDPIDKLEQLRAEMRRKYKPVILPEPEPVVISSEDDPSSFGILEAILIGANLLVWGTVVGLLLRGRKDRGGGGGGDVQPRNNPQPAQLSPSPTAKLMSLEAIGRSMELDADFTGGIKLVSSAAGVSMEFFQQGAEHLFRPEGLNKPEDAVPLAYYWLNKETDKMAKARSSVHVLSDLFTNLAERYGLTSAYIPFEKGKKFGPRVVLSQVVHQIQYGHPIFTAEAISAHLGASWEGLVRWSDTDEAKSYNRVIDVDSLQRVHRRAAHVIRESLFAHGNLSSSLMQAHADVLHMDLRVDVTIQYLHEIAFNLLACRGADVLLSRNDANYESYLRGVSSGMQCARDSFLRANGWLTDCQDYLEVVAGYANDVGSLADGILTGEVRSTASVVPTNTAGIWRIVPLTPLKAVGR